MIVIPAQPGHLDGLLALEESFPRQQQWSAQTWRAELQRDDQIILVALEEETDGVIGAAVFRLAGDVVDLDRVVVGPAWRRRGLARVMVMTGVSWARQQEAERLLLEVADDNEPAIKLYEGHGFTEIARRDDYYGTGRHALILELALTRVNDDALGLTGKWVS